MSFSRDIKHYAATPRTLNQAFGPYAQLHVPPKRYNLRGWVAAIGYGIAVGAFLYVVVLIKVGS